MMRCRHFDLSAPQRARCARTPIERTVACEEEILAIDTSSYLNGTPSLQQDETHSVTDGMQNRIFSS
jgi:hypothetical protein